MPIYEVPLHRLEYDHYQVIVKSALSKIAAIYVSRLSLISRD